MKFGTILKITNVLLPFLPWCDLEKEDSVIDFIKTNFPKLISQIWTIWLANIKTNFAITQSKCLKGNGSEELVGLVGLYLADEKYFLKTKFWIIFFM